MSDSQTIKLLIKAINQIEDYFEYQCESKRDKVYVYSVLDDLYVKLREVNKEESNK